MSPPCRLERAPGVVDRDQQGAVNVWSSRLEEIEHDSTHELGAGSRDWSRTAWKRTCSSCWPSKSRSSASDIAWSDGSTPRPIGPVDLLVRDPAGLAVAVEIKRRGEIDGVEQLSRYLELLNRDPLLAPVRGVLAAQEIKPQARTLAHDRGIDCLVLDYDALRGVDNASQRLF